MDTKLNPPQTGMTIHGYFIRIKIWLRLTDNYSNFALFLFCNNRVVIDYYYYIVAFLPYIQNSLYNILGKANTNLHTLAL